MEKLNKKIDELVEIIKKLINLVLELGTLISIIKMIINSLI